MTEVRDLFLRSHSIGTSYGVAFSPDGNIVCAIGRNVVLWDAHRRRRLASAQPFSHPAHAFFVPDDDSVLVKNTAGDVVRLDAVTLGVRSALGGRDHGEGPGPIAMPQGLFVEGSWGGLLMVRSVEDGRTVFTERHPDSMVVEPPRSSDWSTPSGPTPITACVVPAQSLARQVLGDCTSSLAMAARCAAGPRRQSSQPSPPRQRSLRWALKSLSAPTSVAPFSTSDPASLTRLPEHLQFGTPASGVGRVGVTVWARPIRGRVCRR